MFRIFFHDNDLKVLLGRELPVGQVHVSPQALARFSRQIDRQLRRLHRQMKRKYPTRSRAAGQRYPQNGATDTS